MIVEGGVPLIILLIPFRDAHAHPAPAWSAIWPVFGAANQMLLALSVVLVAMGLRRMSARV